MMPVIIVAIVLLLLLKGKNTTSGNNNETINGITYIKLDTRPKTFTKEDAIEGLQYAKQKYGKEFAQLLERVYRLETAHFQSNQYKGTGTPGMEYGAWGKWILQYFPTNTIYLLKYVDPKRGPKWFIIAPNTKVFADLWHHYVYNIRGGNWAAWNSLDPEKQYSYRNAVNNIANTIIT